MAATALARRHIAPPTPCPDCKVCRHDRAAGLRAFANADACGRCLHVSCPGGGMPQ